MQTKLIPPLLFVLVSVTSASAQDTRTLTPQELFQRNVGSREQRSAPRSDEFRITWSTTHQGDVTFARSVGAQRQ